MSSCMVIQIDKERFVQRVLLFSLPECLPNFGELAKAVSLIATRYAGNCEKLSAAERVYGVHSSCLPELSLTSRLRFKQGESAGVLNKDMYMKKPWSLL